MPTDCVFDDVPRASRLVEDDLVVALLDVNPVSPGHSLVVPKRHVVSWFEATADEVAAMTRLVRALKLVLDDRYRPDGYNVGFNDGSAAGQTVFHAHLHVIPRYGGDVLDPAGGIRHTVPGRGYYSPGTRPSHP